MKYSLIIFFLSATLVAMDHTDTQWTTMDSLISQKHDTTSSNTLINDELPLIEEPADVIIHLGIQNRVIKEKKIQNKRINLKEFKKNRCCLCLLACSYTSSKKNRSCTIL